ncbi:type I polyketide synthase [Actinomadura sp. 9N215]|uniref:type I polyketide synthase n=1 Tax=Actinomadura sp. 9N215 TaxID=3375150 RepID=UPI00379ECFDA
MTVVRNETAAPVAIVGIGCRLPGGVRDLPGLGAVLSSGSDQFREVPPERWGRDFHSPGGERPGTTSGHTGAFLDDVGRFDAAYFGVSPRESAALDPQHRLLLEVAAEAMADTGRPHPDWRGSRTAVYVGMLASDYTLLHSKTLGTAGIGPHYASGVEFSFAAGRLAYAFDLHGPVTTLSSACSSSLLAVHLAAQSLRAGECDSALAGGVNLLLTPELSVFMSRIGAISPTGGCRPFDAAADGVVRGEGCGLVVLKRLPDALADGDRIYATVVGSAVNHDGFSMGLTAPNATAQRDLLTGALAAAGLRPGDIDYVEAHGTGTPLGDRIELSVLADLLGSSRAPDGRPLLVGSHKAVFGHTDAAAGITGLLKAVYVVGSGRVPGQPHLGSSGTPIDGDHAGVAVPTSATGIGSGGAGGPARAGVSAFGLSGTNAHVIVEAPPAPAAEPPAEPAGPQTRPYVLLVSSHAGEGLADQVSRMRDTVAAAGPADLDDLVASAASRRTHEDHRYAVVADDQDGLVRGLAKFPDGVDGTFAGTRNPDAPPRAVFVYSGQGAQWPGMAADLYARDPVVRETLEECDALIRRDASWSLVDELHRTSGSRLLDTDVAQPALFALQVALSRWWTAAGLTPVALLGHSVGEIAAAQVAGRLPLADAVALVVRRGRILHETGGTGRMIAVSGTEGAVREALDATGLPVVIAAVNGPASVVIAGPAGPTREAGRALGAQGFRCLDLPVDYAFHSPVVADCGPSLRAAIADLPPAVPGTVRLLSSVHPGEDLTVPDAAYWSRNLTDPVLFWPAVDRLLAEGDHALVEISPHPVLARPLEDAARHRHVDGPVVHSLRRGEAGAACLRAAAARLHVAGAHLDWGRIVGRPRQYRTLPVPTWGGERHWLPGVAQGQQSGATPADPAAAPVAARVSLLGADGSVVGEFVTGAAPGGTALAGTAPEPPPSGAPAPRTPGVSHGSSRSRRPGSVLAQVEAAVRKSLGLDASTPVPRRRGLFELGLDSMTAVELRSALGSDLGVDLASGVVFDHPTVEALADHLDEVLANADADVDADADASSVPDVTAAPAPAAAVPAPSGGRAAGGRGAEPVAVVGMACRLPGAGSVAEFWALLREGRRLTSEPPADRRADPIWSETGQDVPTRGGFLDDVAGFDAAFFRIAPREARSLDPQQRLLLEVSWEALEDAGLARPVPPERGIGVYVGLNTADYQQLLTRDMKAVDLYYGTGTSFAATAGRLSYVLGLRGPSLAVDTACSSSLTAVHLACQALREGECEAAVVGGANVIVAPTVSVSMAAGGALAPDGRCKTFDEAADGYGRGEGAAALVLKPLRAAERDGDRVYAVIAATAVNQDGASGGLTVPSGTAQTAVIRAALDRGGWAPAEVDYVEAHGTGTPLGDPIEIRALAAALGPGRASGEPLLVGSVKANIGHLEAAAGAAGLVKTILAVQHGEIPPHLVETPSSRIDWDGLPVALPTRPREWPHRERPRRAGVSAFGFTGSNAHVLVEQAPPAPTWAAPPAPRPYVLPVTAATPGALRAAAGRMADRLDGADPGELEGIVHTATRRRAWLDHRVAVLGDDARELSRGLRRFAAGEPCGEARQGHVPGGDPRAVTFWYGDDLPSDVPDDLLAEGTAYARAFDACAARIAELTGARPGPAAAEPPDPRLRAARVFGHHVAATRSLASFGVAPDSVTGTGTGALSAAWAAGRLTQEDALKHLVETGTGLPGNLGPARIPVLAADETDGGARVDVLAAVASSGGGRHAAARTAADLFVTGLHPAWDASAPALPPVDLPSYPWERRRHWYREIPGADLGEPASRDTTDSGEGAGDRAEPGPASASASASAGIVAADELLFTIGWEPVPPPAADGETGTWVVAGAGGAADELVRAFERDGHTVVRLEPGVRGWRERLETVVRDHPGTAGVVVAPGPGDGPGDVDSAVADVLAIGGAMAAMPLSAGRLWLLTRGAPAPGADEAGAASPADAAVWELGRVLAVEIPGRWGGLVAADDARAAVKAVVAQRSGRFDDQVRLGRDGWRAARLDRAAMPAAVRDGVDRDRPHLVMGDAAALPAVTALARRGARRILWFGGRRTDTAQAARTDQTAAAAIAAAGTVVEHHALSELTTVLRAHATVGDVVIMPGPATTRALADVSADLALRNLAGARLLAAAGATAMGHRPRRVTVVTAAGPSWGSVNTAAGAAASGFLTAWAADPSHPVPVGVAGLMPRADTGELGAEHLPLFEQSGLRPLTSAETAGVLDRLLLAEPAYRTVASVDLPRYVRVCQELAPRAFLDRFAGVRRVPERAWASGIPAGALAERLLEHTAGTVTAVLGLDGGDLDPEAGFFDLGMDSVMALGVRTRLEDDLGLDLPSTLTFEYPTTARLAEFLAGLLGADGSAGPPGGPPARPPSGPGRADPPPLPGHDGAGAGEPTDDELLRELERAMTAAERQLGDDAEEV